MNMEQPKRVCCADSDCQVRKRDETKRTLGVSQLASGIILQASTKKTDKPWKTKVDNYRRLLHQSILKASFPLELWVKNRKKLLV